jgi:signal transduction histidine kinase
MKVIGKFAAAFFAVSCVCLLALGYVNAHREALEIETTVRADLKAFGEGLRAGVETSWVAHGPEQALQIVQAAHDDRGDVEVSWVPAGSAPREVDEGVGAKLVAVRVPVEVAGREAGAIVLQRAVMDERAAARPSSSARAPRSAALALLAGALAITLGGTLIGRPLQLVVAQARRIGAGDFSQRLDDTRQDEIGELKRELNTMCDQLSHARHRIEEESEARIETLEQLRHLDRLRTVGTLASSLAHELGTPLNVLLLRGQSLAAGEMQPEEARDAGTTIASQVEKMSKIVRELLDFSSRRAPTRGEVTLGDTARRVAGLLGSIAKKAGVTLDVVIADEGKVLGEAVQLEQAITNLTINAIQAMPQGGTLKLEVGVDDEARASAKAAPVRAAFLRVADEGVGISAEQLTKVFDAFYTTKPAGEGTGLGLGVARGIAEEHGGWLSAKSEVGRGSTFTLYLPRRL